jgi:hypothetical protein
MLAAGYLEFGVVVMVVAWEIRTSGLDLRHWKAMVRSSVSRAVKAVTGFGVAILGDVDVEVVGFVWVGGWLIGWLVDWLV